MVLLIHTNNFVTAHHSKIVLCFYDLVTQTHAHDTSMKKLFIPLLILVIAVSCKKADISFGTEFIDNGNTQVIKLDSFSTELSTVQIDSFVTSGNGVGLIGTYTDPYFGKIKSSSYFEIAPPTVTDDYQNTIFDSVILVGKISRNFYGDTTQPLSISVSRVAEDIIPPNGGTAINNVDAYGLYPAPLATKTMTISPSRDSFVMRLPDALGQEFFGMLARKSDTLKDNTVFLNYFKGLCLQANSGAMIFGLSDTVKVRINYRKNGVFQTNNSVEFPLTTTHYFSNITQDRSGTPLQALSTLKEIPSTATGNAAYSQSTSSAMIKIRFPTVRDILKIPNFKKLLRAQLIIRPLKGSYNTTYSLPPSLRLSQTTQLNQLGADLTYLDAANVAQTQLGGLSIDYLYGENTAYTYDVTNFVISEINTDAFTKNGLLLLPPAPQYTTNFNRVAIGNMNNKNGNIQLQIFYASVQ